MEELKYTVINNEEQYEEYCDRIYNLLHLEKPSKSEEDEIDLLALLIEKWEDEHTTIEDSEPVELLEYLMQNRNINAGKLSEATGISKSVLSDILNYKRGFSKEVIRKLAEFFSVRQEAFNRVYNLKNANRKTRNLKQTA
jgi:HTH-type transcriptional regulator/antitoxin HigA